MPAIFRTTVWSFVGAAGDTNYYRPLMTLTYLFLWKIFGDSPVGYHLFNVLVNALVVMCVYFAGRELFKDRWIALIAATLFAVHPVHTETVNWIAAVPDLEATLFCLLAFYAHIKGPGSDWKRQALVVICFFLALLSKEPALMFAPLVVYYEHFVREGRRETTFRRQSEALPAGLPRGRRLPAAAHRIAGEIGAGVATRSSHLAASHLFGFRLGHQVRAASLLAGKAFGVPCVSCE